MLRKFKALILLARQVDPETYICKKKKTKKFKPGGPKGRLKSLSTWIFMMLMTFPIKKTFLNGGGQNKNWNIPTQFINFWGLFWISRPF